MIDLIKKTMLAGVGAAAISREKVEKSLDELVQRGRISASEAREAANKLADDGKREFEEASKELEERLDSTLRKLGRGHEARIEALETKLATLEGRVTALEPKPKKAAKSSSAKSD